MSFSKTSKSFKAAQGLLLFWFLWVGASVGLHWVSFTKMTPKTGFILFELGVIFLGGVVWLKIESGRSYRKPGHQWYEGEAQAIPGMLCEFILKDRTYHAEVVKIDFDGIFLRLRLFDVALEQYTRTCPVRLFLMLKNRTQICEGRLMSLNSNLNRSGHEVGIQFLIPQGDRRKEFFDFMEELHGYGYL